MKLSRRMTALVASLVMVLMYSTGSGAHFQMILPSTDVIQEGASNAIELQLIFTHPADASHSMDMPRPLEFGVYHKGRSRELTDTLEEYDFQGAQAWTTEFVARGAGDFVFYLVPSPYYESMEDAYITQYTKVIVNNSGIPTDWDVELGLDAEIVPLCRPYGLWAGYVFQGVVKYKGEPVPFAEIKVERLDVQAFSSFPGMGQKYPSLAHVTQVIKADEQGVFTYGIPKSGWWGFAALMEGEDHEGKDHEVGAVIWVKAHDVD